MDVTGLVGGTLDKMNPQNWQCFQLPDKKKDLNLNPFNLPVVYKVWNPSDALTREVYRIIMLVPTLFFLIGDLIVGNAYRLFYDNAKTIIHNRRIHKNPPMKSQLLVEKVYLSWKKVEDAHGYIRQRVLGK